jgi:hypothetical protein|tara:strand:- start:196 stop:378 length:183 start_codon:yes stop_codon:yes gene_type:complete
MINLEEHKIYIESHKMDMVPLSVAVQAVQEAVTKETEHKLDEALGLIKKSLYNIDIDTND